VQLYALINEARLGEGLPPYEWSRDLLDVAAQRHADDLATHGLAGHVGSDGSTAAQRIAEAGYVAWGDGEVVGENVRVAHETVQEAFDWFMAEQDLREGVLNALYREIGIGVAADSEDCFYYVLDFGARPNVLPVFINDGAATTESPQVALRLTNEEACPQGEGTAYMGRAIEVRIANGPDFDDLAWQAWEPLLAWTLPEEPGEHTVYVQFRDGAGRTAASADVIVLLEGEATPASVSPTGTSLPPSETPTSPPPSPHAPTPTSVEVSAPTPTSTPIPLGGETTAPPTPFPTWTPLPPPSQEGNSGAGALLESLCALEVVAALMGGYLALRRGRSGGYGT